MAALWPRPRRSCRAGVRPASVGPAAVQEILGNRLDAKQRDDLWNFDSAMIEDLPTIGYPAHKILWYRGGMQAWESLGLTTLKPLGK